MKWIRLRALTEEERLDLEPLAYWLLFDVRKAAGTKDPLTELNIRIHETGLSQIERSEQYQLREKWALALSRHFGEPKAHSVEDGWLVTYDTMESAPWPWFLPPEPVKAESQPIQSPGSISTAQVVSEPDPWDLFIQRVDFEIPLNYSRRLTEQEWQILQAVEYTNPRWTISLQENQLRILRLGGTFGFQLNITELPDGTRVGPGTICGYQEGNTAWTQDEAKRLTREILDGLFDQGKYLFYEPVFAVVGDVHGHIDLMIDTLNGLEDSLNQSLDFVLQVGDFMPVRNEADLAYVYGPRKYRLVGDFPRYLGGEAKMPWPLYFIGGNHEPYGFLEEVLPSGTDEPPAEIAENCFYLGRYGTAEPCGVSVGGLSGSYSSSFFNRERPPSISPNNARLFASFNNVDLNDLWNFWDLGAGQWTPGHSMDMLLLHDWPAGLVPRADLLTLDQQYGRGDNDYDAWWAVAPLSLMNPEWVVCGHHHLRRSYRYGTPENGTRIECLADISQGAHSIALFTKKNGRVSLHANACEDPRD